MYFSGLYCYIFFLDPSINECESRVGSDLICPLRLNPYHHLYYQVNSVIFKFTSHASNSRRIKKTTIHFVFLNYLYAAIMSITSSF